MKGQGNTKMPDPTEDGAFTPHTTPAISTGPSSKREGDATQQTGGTAPQHPPFHHYATPSSHATPPSTMPPPTTTTRGEQTEDTPPHEHHRQTHATHTAEPGNETAHYMIAVLMSTAPGWA